MRREIVAALSCLFLAASAASQDTAAAGRSAADLWRTARACGTNCLYLLLQSRGLDVSYADVAAAVDVGEAGSSLPQLREAASRLGLDVEICRGSPGGLARAELPWIAHLEAGPSAAEGLGHFVVLVEYDEDAGSVKFFDGTTALYYPMAIDRFRRAWSGYVLRPVPPGDRTWTWSILAAAAGLALVVVARRRSVARAVRGGT